MAGRILVLDDEENYAEMLQDLLRENNYRVDMATRPERAIAQLEEIPYDLVISDYKMPVMDGADFLKKARELYPDLPFILVSGLMNTPELVKVANMSVTLVMEKPLDTQSFLQHVARFSEPMTELEKEQVDLEIKSVVSDTLIKPYPQKLRFFSASNLIANRFLMSAWALAKGGVEMYVYEPIGGDAEQLLKDLSCWRGNGDVLVDLITFPESYEVASSQVRTIVSDTERSSVVGVRLSSVADITRARRLTALVKSEIENPESLLLVYIVSAAETVVDFKQAAKKDGVVLPPLCQRPSDVAVYARRFARIAAVRSGRSLCAEFTPEVAYFILAYEWSGNYKQLQKVVSDLVDQSPDEAISLATLRKVLGEEPIKLVAPEDRIAALMRAEQRRHFKYQIEQEALSATDLAKKLELDDSIHTKDDLYNMPLLHRELGNF